MPKVRWLNRCLLVLWPLLIALPAAAQLASVELSDPAFDQLVDTWNQSLDNVELELGTPTLTRERTKALLENIRIVRKDAAEIGEMAAAEAEIARRMLAALGPAPAEGEPGEDQVARAERQRIRDRITRYESRYKRCRLVLARVDILIEQIAVAERRMMLRVMRERVQWSFDLVPAVWAQLRDKLQRDWGGVAREWRAASPQQKAGLIALCALFLLSLMPVWVLRRWMLRHHGRDPSLPTPSRRRQLSACVMEILANGILPASLIATASAALQSDLLRLGDIGAIINVLLLSGLQWVLLVALASAALAPNHPQWRLHSLGDAAAKGLYRSLLWLLLAAILLKIFNILFNPHLSGDIWVLSQDTLFNLFASQRQVAVVLGGTALFLVALLMLHLLRPRHWRLRRRDEAAGAAEEVPPPLPLRTLLWFARLSMFGCLLLGLGGYIGAGLLILMRVSWTLITLGLLWLARHLIGESLLQLTMPGSRAGARLRQRLVLDDMGMERLLFWLHLLINSAVAVTGGVVLLLIWGMPRAYLEQFSTAFIHGFSIGGLSLSPMTIAGALAVFAVLLTGARLLRSFLSQRLLVQTKLDIGVRDALSTVTGYIGVFVAVLAALSVLGVDFGEIALVLGGLSIGIGLGLQHIVNNFVSGLVLLFQRPIKAGDWVVVGNFQGYVKHVKVIATEIQTFDNASVLVPNSKMASTEVLNWTHRSKVGRVIVAVGVAYDSDPEQVKAILLACAEAHPDVLSRPEPHVLFQNFGSSALEFEIRFHLRDIDNLLRVASEMRFAIRTAFADAGVVIPFPQHDVHLYQAKGA